MTQLEKSVSFNFMGIGVLVKSNSVELIERLSKDFSYYVDKLEKTAYFTFNSILEDNISLKIPAWPEIRKSKNSITYERGSIRINDYFGKLISKYDYGSEEGELHSNSIEKLHEITYLIILSRVGKYFDLKGIHKIHALGVIYKNTCAVGMMNMGVGKSTLLIELLKDNEVSLMSDDTPLVNTDGEIKQFPIRIGLENLPQDLLIKEPEKNIYSLQREFYGKKNLISVEGIENDIGEFYERLILFEGVRGHGKSSQLTRSSKLALWIALQKHMVIGFGLPLIFEYFWESGPVDFLRKTKIFFLRQIAAYRLLSKCSYFKFYMSENPSENARVLKKYMTELATNSS